jgi:hypothetical protein
VLVYHLEHGCTRARTYVEIERGLVLGRVAGDNRGMSKNTEWLDAFKDFVTRMLAEKQTARDEREAARERMDSRSEAYDNRSEIRIRIEVTGELGETMETMQRVRGAFYGVATDAEETH